MKALITGASSGIGRDMARYLASMGWDLILVARRIDRLEELKKELLEVDVRCIRADVSTYEECLRLYEETRDDPINMLVNNAGFGLAGEFVETDLERELQMVDVNVKALHTLTKLYLKDFVARDSGIILNVASSAGFMAGPLMATYYATKNYVLRLCEAISEELRRKNSKVRICALCPGPVKTEFDKVASVKFSMDGISSEYCARYAIDQALKGKRIIIPSSSIKAGIFFKRFLSESFLLKIAYNFQRRKNYR
ncbi:MAG: SDR family NAD(P)-dependent oxidoreductase [Ruminococcus sp.]|nr:SDR family NAD(P)-dependent oxidoreductase [Ruminococcus sp.]